jgi:hypothetical protein
MTTSGQARKPRRQPAAAAGTPASGSPPAGPAAMAGAGETAADASRPAGTSPGRGRPADAAAAGPAAEADPHRAAQEGPVGEAGLRQEIEQTRELLGETVEQLAAKTDVKGRARA